MIQFLFALVAIVVLCPASAHALSVGPNYSSRNPEFFCTFATCGEADGPADGVCDVTDGVSPDSNFERLWIELFFMNVPAEAVSITGIKVEGKAGMTGCAASARLLLYGNPTGESRPLGGAETTDCSQTEFSRAGDVDDLWGRAWTRDEVNDANFGVQITTLGCPNFFLDTVRITAYYSDGSVTTTHGPTTSTTLLPTTTTTTLPPSGPCPASPADCKVAGKSLVSWSRKEGAPAQSKFLWKWSKGDETDFGTPPATDGDLSFQLCVYEGNGFNVAGASIPGGTAWKATGSGFLFKDKTGASDGITLLKLKTGAGSASITMKGSGADLAVPSLPPAQSPNPVKVQLHSFTTGECWGSSFAAPALSGAGDMDKFKDDGN